MLLKLINESALFALHALWANKLRTLLSLLGITIGIFAVIAVFTFIDTWENKLKDSLAVLGNDVYYVQKWPWEFSSEYPWWKYMNRPVPGYKEYEAIADKLTLASAVCFQAGAGSQKLKFEDSNVSDVTVFGVSYDYQDIRVFEILNGRYFTPSEAFNGDAKAVMGATIANALFGDVNPVGKAFVWRGRKILVIGVFEKEGSNLANTSMDEVVIVPAAFFKKLINIDSEMFNPTILVKANAPSVMEDLRLELLGAMRAIRKLKPMQDENFALNKISFLATQLESLFGLVAMVGWVIGGFSILVGGFGIANIMFVSVRERTSIIGIQKALGAKKFFILFQFLIESVLLAIIGGVLGLFVVFLMVLAANAIGDFGLSLSLKNIFIGISISSIIGVLAGFIPALKASQMDPVEAIRFVG